MNNTKQPLLIWSSVLVTLQILTGGAALGDLIGLQLAGFFILVVAALQGGTQFYIRGMMTPNVSVAARVDDQGSVVAGPAAPQADGSPVNVVPAPEGGGA